jgi:hypothetical protein
MKALKILIIVSAISSTNPQSFQKEFINNLPSKIVSINPEHFAFVSINKDNFLDIALIENNKLNVFLNQGNGKISDEPIVSYTLKQDAIKLSNCPDANSKVNVTYKNGSMEQIDLRSLCEETSKAKNFFNKTTADSISFEPVWNYTLTENTGGWGMTAGDIDKDG